MIDRPKVFRWTDVLTFGLAAMIVTGLAVWVLFSPYTDGQIAGKIITWLTALAFWFVYAMLIRWRWETACRVAYVTVHGIYVVLNEFNVPRTGVELFTEDLLRRWEVESGWNGVRHAVEKLWLVWMPYPFEHHSRPKFKFMGLASGTSHAIAVGYIHPLTASALGHELGHVVFQAWQGLHAEEQFRAFAISHKLPY